ncbi:MAG: insulinase family protein [Caldilineales bacterium]|nr:insulinase family protein [Caldilineales bacterium]
MTTRHGFALIKETEIAELNTYARLYRHTQSGAELLSLSNDDENKVFGVTFRTPPEDSTGVAHILEHAVLAGSRKYPVKEPFVELLKGSLKTFVNAFTMPDRTCYPVASQNLQDFYNLIDVYLDAVFYPLLSPHTFKREAWRYELTEDGQALEFKGVVFNEMKGVYSDPDSQADMAARHSLFPGHIYGLDSGGNPKNIPDLTYEQFKRFHDDFYHPANARIFFYGDDPEEARLEILDGWLCEFTEHPVDSHIAMPAPFAAPIRMEETVSAGEDGSAYVIVNWGLTDSTDAELNLGLGILGRILVGTSASPLRKALIDSGLGEDLAGFGMEGELVQSAFSTGLKGIDLAQADAVESLIFETLEKLVKEGIDPRTVEAAMNTTEFHLRELNTGGFPRGLAVMLASLSTWIYDGDPLSPLQFEAPLADIKARLAAGEPYFESLIERHLLQNPHRTTLILRPDPGLGEQWEAEEAARLEAAKAAMSDADIQAVIEEAEEQIRILETPDSPEALAAIPRLTLADLDRENKLIPIAVSAHKGSDILYHDLFTNGITYLDVGMNLGVVPQELLPMLPLFGRALLDLGTEHEDFVSLSQRIGSKTGGISDSLFLTASLHSERPVAWLFLRGKAMADKTADLLDILHDVLTSARFDNRERFRQIVLEEKSGQEASLIPAGHGVINSRLRSHFDAANWAAEQTGGVSQLFFLRELARQVESDWPGVLDRLETLRSLLVNRQDMLWNVTLDAENWAQVQPQIHALIEKFPARPSNPASWAHAQPLPFEGLTIPAPINFVGKAANLYDLGYKLHGSVHVITGYLRTTWLWDRIRMHGGAYGAFSLFDQRSGVFSYLSYRDPNLAATLQNYDRTGEFLRKLDVNDDELTKGIIGTISALDAHLLPDAKGFVSMQRHLLGETDEFRQRVRDEILSTTAADFRAFADVLDEVSRAGHVVALGSQAAIEQANASREDKLVVTKVM